MCLAAFFERELSLPFNRSLVRRTYYKGAVYVPPFPFCSLWGLSRRYRLVSSLTHSPPSPYPTALAVFILPSFFGHQSEGGRESLPLFGHDAYVAAADCLCIIYLGSAGPAPRLQEGNHIGFLPLISLGRFREGSPTMIGERPACY